MWANMADIAAAWHRAERVLRRNPKTGLQADVPATAVWNGGTKAACTHSNGTTVVTDMPTQMGGDGTGVTPGWLMRAGLASCAATTIAMNAAVAGIRLATLEIVASSLSDTRGLLGMMDTDGKPVSAGPRNVQLRVRISAADDTSPQILRALVERSHRCTPVACAIQDATCVELSIDCELD
jgi:organic hydroperoxide reductase OsmC/OhrA